MLGESFLSCGGESGRFERMLLWVSRLSNITFSAWLFSLQPSTLAARGDMQAQKQSLAVGDDRQAETRLKLRWRAKKKQLEWLFSSV
jgi:hypothetical protein